MIQKSKLKEQINKHECYMGEDLHTALEVEVNKLILKTVMRAKANNRKTVYPRDL